MSKAIIVVDFAYKGTTRKGRGTGRKGLSSTLKYLQYRDKVQNQLAENRDYERWQDRGMGVHWREILQNSDALQSKHVLAWTWVVSPAPDLMALVPEAQRRDFVCDLTERIVEDYYAARGFDTCEYSYILHDRATNDDGQQQLHTHIVLPERSARLRSGSPSTTTKSAGTTRFFVKSPRSTLARCWMRTSAPTGGMPARTPNAPYKGGAHALLAIYRRTRTLRQPDVPAAVPVVAVATADGGTVTSDIGCFIRVQNLLVSIVGNVYYRYYIFYSIIAC